jgi:hypothetical protein
MTALIGPFQNCLYGLNQGPGGLGAEFNRYPRPMTLGFIH